MLPPREQESAPRRTSLLRTKGSVTEHTIGSLGALAFVDEQHCGHARLLVVQTRRVRRGRRDASSGTVCGCLV
jgi:hypothetical protein